MAKKSSKNHDVQYKKIEIELPSERYNFLKEKAESLSSEEEATDVNILSYLLLTNAILKYKVLTPKKTKKELLEEYKQLHELDTLVNKNPDNDTKLRIEAVIHYVLNNTSLSTLGQFEELKRGLAGYFTNKELLLDVIDYIKRMNKTCYIENEGSLILFEDFVKKLPSDN